MYAGLRNGRSKGRNLKKVVVVEAGSAAANLHARMPILHEHGYHIGSVLQLQHSDDWLVKLERALVDNHRSEEHTSELQSLMRISYAVFFLKNKIKKKQQ